MNTVVVTGGAGFIGSHLVRRLASLGSQVHVIDNLSTGRAEKVPPEAVLHTLDIRSPDAYKMIVSIQPDVVVHLAAQADVQQSIRDPFLDMDINIGGTLNILNACREAKVRKVIFASTSGVYGNLQKDIMTENDPTHPISFYGLSKLAGEQYIRLYTSLFGLSHAILRFANVYGPGQTAKGEGGVVAIFMDRIHHDRQLVVNGDGNQTRDFIYVKDVVEALIAASSHPEDLTLHVSTGKAATVNDLVSFLRKFHSREIHVQHGPDKSGDIRHSCLSNQAIQRKLLWKPVYSLEQGLQETYRSFVDRM
ncbi:NAD-dependent epimerase/dehydratase family protein [Paenibacillus favisporus]|uniref:NAD-dependent epimerase/dehydratase family protein n=1 Tax=Paenibacillus favisporus TaxID=221028 RepID=UPI0013D50B4A|nr:NAD-dependent epimerase/dehydratase family protein [Paenibacillus favisporus]